MLLFIIVGVSNNPRPAATSATVVGAGCADSAGCATVPNMIGKTRSAASSAMDEAGFTGGREEFAQVPEFSLVIAQTPLPGTVIGKEDQVQLTFSGDPMAAAAPAAAPVQAASSGPLATFGSGTYEVGTGDGQVAPASTGRRVQRLAISAPATGRG